MNVEHPHVLVYAGIVEEEGKRFELWCCSSPGCELKEQRPATE